MERDKLVEELLPIARDFIGEESLSDEGLSTMLRFILTKIELSKLNQKKDISTVCQCKCNRIVVRHEEKDWCNVCGELVKEN